MQDPADSCGSSDMGMATEAQGKRDNREAYLAAYAALAALPVDAYLRPPHHVLGSNADVDKKLGHAFRRFHQLPASNSGNSTAPSGNATDKGDDTARSKPPEGWALHSALQ